MTPTQFIAVFFKTAGTAEGSIDRLEELTKYNRERGKRGEKPVIPSWLG
jgi:hypothetical protein